MKKSSLLSHFFLVMILGLSINSNTTYAMGSMVEYGSSAGTMAVAPAVAPAIAAAVASPFLYKAIKKFLKAIGTTSYCLVQPGKCEMSVMWRTVRSTGFVLVGLLAALALRQEIPKRIKRATQDTIPSLDARQSVFDVFKENLPEPQTVPVSAISSMEHVLVSPHGDDQSVAIKTEQTPTLSSGGSDILEEDIAQKMSHSDLAKLFQQEYDTIQKVENLIMRFIGDGDTIDEKLILVVRHMPLMQDIENRKKFLQFFENKINVEEILPKDLTREAGNALDNFLK